MIAAMGGVGSVDPGLPYPGAPPREPTPGAPTFGQALAAAFAATSGAPVPPPLAALAPPVAHGQAVGLGQRVGAGAPASGLSLPVTGASASVDSPPATGAGMVRPADGRVSSEFGPRVHPVTGQRRPHNGIDVAGPVGAPIRAAAAGTVTFAGTRGGYGNLIIIDHGDGRETYYAHNSVHAVSVGDRVTAGQHIGAIGATGVVTGPHLHFEVHINGEPVQPRDHVTF